MLLLAIPSVPDAQAAGRLLPYDLRCEALVEPLGIGRTQPALSWKLRAQSKNDRGLKQNSYRILAASDPGLLEFGRADLWDSGEVASDGTYGIAYAGKPLVSGQRVFWRVAVFESGTAPRWSKAASFSVGLLRAEDWRAKWIAFDAPDRSGDNPFKGASWIWSAKDDPKRVGKVERTFTRTFPVADVSNIESATIDLSVDDQFTVFVNGVQAGASDGRGDAWRRPVRVEIATMLKSGDNEVKIVARNDGDQAGAIARINLHYGAEVIVSYPTNASWLDDDGAEARVLGEFGMLPWNNMGVLTLRPATFYRKGFSVAPKLKRATAYVTALGLVDLHLNGERVSEDLFNPGWTSYDKRVYYRTFDVTKLVKSGANAVGAIVGDGWYSGYIGYDGRRGFYGDRPHVRVQLDLEYADGRTETIGTDESWRAGTAGIVEQDFLAGELHDARLDQPGWDRAGFRGEGWKVPYTVEGLTMAVEAHVAPPVRPYERLKPKTVKEVRPGVYILDFGQNLAGFAHLKIKGEKGQRITMKFVEVLNPDGTIYTANLRGARATDHYICRGDKDGEEWSPRFTFHGFQYLEVSGLRHAPKADEIVAVAISSATPEVGKFESSDKMLNQLSHNAWWTQKMNFIDVPTDCPQRDERLGWTGDAQAYIGTAAMYSDVQPFFNKWLVSLEDDQRADGQFPMVAPLKVAEDDGGPAWADAGVICPWEIYQAYGDKRQLAERYDSMKRFVDFMVRRSTPDLLPPERFHCFGDWLQINANTPPQVIYEAYFAGSARLLARSADALGKTEDARKYHKLADDVRTAFNKAYVTVDGVVAGDTQCVYVLALWFDLLDEEKAKMAADRLVADIERRDWHLSTGFVGTRDLMWVLSKIGRDDVAFRLLHNTTFPSWGFEIANGATTIWERWDGWTPEKGFQDPGMNSFAHYAYGAVMQWVFAKVGGIDNAEPGYAKIQISPTIDPNLTWAKTSYDSVRGPIRTEWRKEGGGLALTVEIPPNATAEIRMPTQTGSVKTDAVGTTRVSGEAVTYKVGSGTYRFATDWH